MSSYIYKITNIENNKIYIGQTRKSIKERWKNHIADSKRADYKFSRAIKKYGIFCWKIDILEKLENIELLNEREKYWISLYNSVKEGYNSTYGGNQLVEYSTEILDKIKKSSTGRIMSEDTKKKISLAKTGMKYGPHSEETKRKMSEIAKGRIFSEEHKRKIGEKHKGKIITNEQKIAISNARKKEHWIWITNKIVNKKIKFDATIPIGWSRGRTNYWNISSENT